MNIAFCVGNGASRKSFDLEQLKDLGPVYGCNQLVETFALDNTIVVDKMLLIDLLSKGYDNKTNLYTRQRWKNLVGSDKLNFLKDPVLEPKIKWDNELQWGSGTHAINLAASNNAQLIVMIGYDLYLQNLYSNQTVDPACWIYQIKKCFEMYPNVQFVQIQNSDWVCPQEWDNDNFTIDTFANLLELIKELS